MPHELQQDLLIKNNIKFLKSPGASYQDTSFFLKTLFKSKKVIFIENSLLNYRQTNLNSSINNNSIEKAMFILKEFSEFEKFIKTDINSFIKIEKIYNTKKFHSLFWNLERIDNKKEFIKIIYQQIYKIVKKKIIYLIKSLEMKKFFLIFYKNMEMKLHTKFIKIL